MPQVEDEIRHEGAGERPARAHGCVQRLTLAVAFVGLYLVVFWVAVGALIYWLVA